MEWPTRWRSDSQWHSARLEGGIRWAGRDQVEYGVTVLRNNVDLDACCQCYDSRATLLASTASAIVPGGRPARNSPSIYTAGEEAKGDQVHRQHSVRFCSRMSLDMSVKKKRKGKHESTAERSGRR